MTDLSRCERCGQSCITHHPDGWEVPMTQTGAIVCAACRKLDRAPQGETVRLFEPAPAQMPGQLGWPDDAAPVDHVDNDGYAIHDA